MKRKTQDGKILVGILFALFVAMFFGGTALAEGVSDMAASGTSALEESGAPVAAPFAMGDVIDDRTGSTGLQFQVITDPSGGSNGSVKVIGGGYTTAGITVPSTITHAGNIYDVVEIGDAAFRNCTSLSSITLPNSITSIGDEAFRYCTSLSSITLPNSITSIGDAAFRNCTSLSSITLPNSITSIGYAAFRDCISLSSITFWGETVPSFGTNIFASISTPIDFFVPSGKISDYTAALGTMPPAGSTIMGSVPPSVDVTTLKFDFNGTKHPNITINMGSGAVVRAEITSADTSIAEVTPASLSASGTATVTVRAVGNTNISVEFYDALNNVVSIKTVIVQVEDIIPPKPPVKLTDYPVGQIPSSENNYTMKVDVDYADFKNVEIDGKAITSADFTSWAGSTFVRLTPSFLAKLSTGNHIITLNFKDGTATTAFAKAANTNGGATGAVTGGSSGMATSYKDIGKEESSTSTNADGGKNPNYNPSTGGGVVLYVTYTLAGMSVLMAIVTFLRKREFC